MYSSKIEIAKKEKLKDLNESSNLTKIKPNLKIFIDNSNKSIDENQDEELEDYEMEDESNKDLSKNDKYLNLTISTTVNKDEEETSILVTKDDNISDVSDDEEGEEDETEFHVNLDKVPPSLQNTTLNEKIYINEAIKHDPNPPEDLNVIDLDELKSLYESLGLNESSFMNENEIEDESVLSKSRDKNLSRKEALHLYGVDDLSTNDIFEFFKDYKPFAVEWIDDSSCNVVWRNGIHTANAILKMSIPYDDNSESFFNNETLVTDPKLSLDENLRKKRPPQGSKWRRAVNDFKGCQIYMRFVRKSDRKIKGAEARSRYYVKYGNPNYGNMTGLISTSKRRRMKVQQLNDAMSDLFDEETETKTKDQIYDASRQLVSYDLDDYKTYSSGETEEFGTGIDAENKDVLPKENEPLNESRSPFKRKKMRMYSDDINEDDNISDQEEKLAKRKNRFGLISSSNDRHTSKLKVEDRLDYGSRNSGRKNMNNRPTSYMNNNESRNSFGKPFSAADNPNDLRYKLNSHQNRKSFRL